MSYQLTVHVNDSLFGAEQQLICVFDINGSNAFRRVPFDGEISLEPLQLMMCHASSLDDAASMIRKQLTPP